MTASIDMSGVGDDWSSICASICLPEVSDELRCLVVSHVACGPASSVAVTAKHLSHSLCHFQCGAGQRRIGRRASLGVRWGRIGVGARVAGPVVGLMYVHLGRHLVSAVGWMCGTSTPRRIVTHRVSWVGSRRVRGSAMLVAVRRAAAPGAPHARSRARVAAVMGGRAACGGGVRARASMCVWTARWRGA